MWHQPRCDGEPPAGRYGHSVTVVGSRIFLFFGRSEGGALHRDVYALDTSNWRWSVVKTTTSAPQGRFWHSQAAVGNKVVIFGGWDGRKALDDLWVFDPGERARIRCHRLPHPRRHAGVDQAQNQRCETVPTLRLNTVASARRSNDRLWRVSPTQLLNDAVCRLMRVAALRSSPRQARLVQRPKTRQVSQASRRVKARLSSSRNTWRTCSSLTRRRWCGAVPAVSCRRPWPNASLF
jgi:hypothetical protein